VQESNVIATALNSSRIEPGEAPNNGIGRQKMNKGQLSNQRKGQITPSNISQHLKQSDAALGESLQ